jgi:hypothetical protein
MIKWTHTDLQLGPSFVLFISLQATFQAGCVTRILNFDGENYGKSRGVTSNQMSFIDSLTSRTYLVVTYFSPACIKRI